MKGIYKWLYVDYKENTWKFFVNNDGQLYYAIMYEDGKWTKNNLIDSKVIGFGLFINEYEGIHLVYGNIKGELRYCTLKDKNWLGKVLYRVEDERYDIESIKVKILGPIMHVFFVLASKDGSDHGILMHCTWDGNEIKTNKLQDIILRSELNEYYLININNKNEIYLFYLSDEGDEIALNYIAYENNIWRPSIRLYGIEGEELYFDVEVTNKIHILNKSRENSTYSLEHVIIDLFGTHKGFNIYSSKYDLKEPLIFKEGKRICACWIEKDFIYYSTFNGMEWGKPIKLITENSEDIERYNGYITNIKESSIREVKLYGTMGLDLYLYYPDKFSGNYNELQNNNIKKEENKESINNEVDILKEENQNLEDKITHLSLLFQKSQRNIEEYKQQIAIILEQKRKAEENNDIFIDLQKSSQIKYEDLSKELGLLKEEIALKNNELNENSNIIKDLENQNKILIDENSFIKEENKKISEELEIEKNQSVMDRLLRRRG